MSTEARTPFDYLLNAFERASQSDNPAGHGYGDKRRALFAYVRDLERRPQPATDEFIEAAARKVKPIVVSGEPSWEHGVVREYERARGMVPAALTGKAGKE